MRHPLANVSVLLVDDNENMLKLHTQMLRRIGVRAISQAYDCPTALSLLRIKPYDVVLCSWEMSPIDGLSFGRMLRHPARSPNTTVPVILLTSRIDRKLVEAVRDAGLDDVVTRPLSPATLEARIVAVIGRLPTASRADGAAAAGS